MNELARFVSWREIHSRLAKIFPEGTPHREHCVWEIAARTIFVMLYANAVEGSDVWLRPDQVTRMTDVQAAKVAVDERFAWTLASVVPSKGEIPGRWYAVNTRESIRDDTLRNALVANGAIVERQGLPTTSPAGRYALQKEFAFLFDPNLTDIALDDAIAAWQEKHLTSGALMRIALIRQGAAAGTERVLVTFPNGETRLMAPGPSSLLSKRVVEVFAPRFLQAPAVIFLSESKDKVVARDDAMAKRVGLTIAADKNLPDVVLADVGPSQPLLVFIEVVATDGPMSEARKSALLALTDQGGFPRERVAFVTAFMDRSSPPFKKTVNILAWGSFVWCAAEPACLIELTSDRKHLLR